MLIEKKNLIGFLNFLRLNQLDWMYKTSIDTGHGLLGMGIACWHWQRTEIKMPLVVAPEPAVTLDCILYIQSGYLTLCLASKFKTKKFFKGLVQIAHKVFSFI